MMILKQLIWAKKKKYTRKYKYVEYASFVNRQALATYKWDQCIRDMVKEYGNKETAAKVCSAIKNRTVKRQSCEQ